MHSSCRWAGECSYTPYLRMRPPKFLKLSSRSVAFNHALLKAIFKREDTSEGWAAIASSEWCIPNLLWKWSSAYWVADISFSSLNDWLSKAQQDSCSPKYAKLICTSNQSTMLFMITTVTMTLLVIEESFPDWWHLSEGQFCDNTSAARSNLFSEQLNALCRTTAALGHFRHSWLQRHVCVYIWSFHECIFLEIKMRSPYTYLPVSKRKVRSSSLVLTSLLGTAAASHTLCKVNSVRFWPCTFLPRHRHRLEFRALETPLEAFDTPQHPLAIPSRDSTINNVRYNINRTSYIPRSIINYRSRQDFLSHNYVFFCLNSFPHFCDVIFTPVCLCPDCSGIILH